MHRSDGSDERIRVLVVHPQDAGREAIARVLWNHGYEVITAESGERALTLLRTATPAVMLCDIALPDMSGLDLLDALAATFTPAERVPAVMITGTADAHASADCLQRGAVDYLTRPFTMVQLRETMRRALETHGTSPRGPATPEAHPQVEASRDRVLVPTLEALVAALEAKNVYFAGHSARVATFAATIAHHLALGDDEIEQVRIAGRLHDLGMIGVRDQVIDKRGTLTPEERAQVQQHVRVGARILAPLTNLGGEIVDAVRTHHERWDGAGYPDGLEGEAIPLGGRILGACEVFDALTTRRPYRDQVEPEAALERMRGLAGTVVDPAVVVALASAVEHRQTLTFLR